MNDGWKTANFIQDFRKLCRIIMIGQVQSFTSTLCMLTLVFEISLSGTGSCNIIIWNWFLKYHQELVLVISLFGIGSRNIIIWNLFL